MGLDMDKIHYMRHRHENNNILKKEAEFERKQEVYEKVWMEERGGRNDIIIL